MRIENNFMIAFRCHFMVKKKNATKTNKNINQNDVNSRLSLCSIDGRTNKSGEWRKSAKNELRRNHVPNVCSVTKTRMYLPFRRQFDDFQNDSFFLAFFQARNSNKITKIEMNQAHKSKAHFDNLLKRNRVCKTQYCHNALHFAPRCLSFCDVDFTSSRAQIFRMHAK